MLLATYDADNTAIVTDGPFAEAKEVVGGYWIIQTKTREAALEWAKRAPLGDRPVPPQRAPRRPPRAARARPRGPAMRPALCEDALRLGRIVAELVPGDPEVHGLVALMEIQASRTPARTAPDGMPILLPDQDRSRWERALLEERAAGLG